MSPTQGANTPFGTPFPDTVMNTPTRKRKADNETLFDIPADEMLNVRRINTAMTGAKLALTAAIAAAQKNFAVVAGQLDDEKVALINRVAALYGKDTDVHMSLDVANALLVYGDTDNEPLTKAFMEASEFAKPTMEELDKEVGALSTDELAALATENNANNTKDKTVKAELLKAMKESLASAGFSAKVVAAPTSKDISAAVKNMSIEDITRIALNAVKPYLTQDFAQHIVRYLIGADEMLHNDISCHAFLNSFVTSMGVVRAITTRAIPKMIVEDIMNDKDMTADSLCALFLPIITPPESVIDEPTTIKSIDAVKNMLKFLFEIGYPDPV